MNGSTDEMPNQSHISSSGIPTLSLFSGAGGLDIGFLQAGFDIQACVEIEPRYAATLQKNVANSHQFGRDAVVHCQDIKDFNPEPYKKAGIRCIIGGPPCQTFSAAGRRSGGVIGLDDQRGQLFRAYCRILREISPEVFVFENVYGLPGANGGKPWKEIIAAFAEEGYELRAEVVDTADYGVPQHRERLVMVGFKSRDFVFPMPTHGPDSKTGKPLVSVEQAIADLQDPAEASHNGLGGLYGHLLPAVPEGLNYAYFTAEMGHPHPMFAWRSKFHDLLYKVKRDEPCRTIKAQPGKFTGPFHWKNRHFTAAELKRLQSFPDDYDIVGSYAKVVEQIGNSVPPRLAFVIACSVREQLLGEKSPIVLTNRPPGFQSTFRQRQRERSERFKTIARTANLGLAKSAVPKSRSASDRYSLNPANIFDRTKLKFGHSIDNAFPSYDVSVVEDGNHIDIQVVKAGCDPEVKLSAVSILGLSKYLGAYDTCSVLAQIDSISDIFHCWNAIEDTLVSRSRFFTLIDIYGHYANKGDAVQITADWRVVDDLAAALLLNRFASTTRCGEFVQKDSVRNELAFDEDTLARNIAILRTVRFDLRTSDTHPIIGEKRMICTYPFPLLSPRALVESKVKLLPQIEDEVDEMSLVAFC